MKRLTALLALWFALTTSFAFGQSPNSAPLGPISGSGGGSPTLTQIMALYNTVDIATCAGVVYGYGQSGAQQIANGAALQTCFDQANTAKSFLGCPANTIIEYNAQGVEGATNTGLQVKKDVAGFIGAGTANLTGGTSGCILVQYASGFPAITLGDVGTNAADQTFQATYSGFQIGYGVDQCAVTGGYAIQLGRIWSSTFDNIYVSPFAAGGGRIEAYVGMYMPNITNNFFFANNLPLVTIKTGCNNLLWEASNTTGNNWGILYLAGGTTFNSWLTSTDQPVRLENLTNFGTIDLMKIEWNQTASGQTVLFLNNVGGFTAQQVRFEGNRLIGFNAAIINASLSQINIEQLILYNNTIATADVSGTPTIIHAFSNANVNISGGFWQWNSAGDGNGVATAAFSLFTQDGAAGNRSHVTVMNIPMFGYTGAFSPDSTLTAANIGVVQNFEKYTYDPVQSVLEGASILAPSGNGTVNVRGSLWRPKIVIDTVITADRSVVVLDAAGTSSNAALFTRPPNSTVEVYRTGNATGAFNVLVRDPTNSTTLATLGTANTQTLIGLNGLAYQISSIPVGSAVSLTTATPANVTTLSLIPGNWTVCGNVAFNPGATTTQTDLIGGISTTTATLPTAPGNGAYARLQTTLTTGVGSAFSVGCIGVQITATTSYFLVAQSTFAISTQGAYGALWASRN